ncbi:GDP-L-galactose phosphorylase 2 isoform X1 [Aegilops tauschii subsp. strangulata]|uniref:GDP-D-glucose phosphorylase 1 n=3 Tax=Aegilops tauschii TaxID=37682 RepID=A0A453K4F5_AEGTS|nr:GDP-L-galactose phosphorylase 2 isoform X1 [Aegilops tauschii subsp. strangulata]
MKLTIKRVPTVVSNYQEDAGERPRGGCGRNCLGHCCLPVSELPVYAFKANPTKLPLQEDAVPTDFFINLLLGQWEDRMTQGLFRYDVTACETKVIPGNLGFVAQLNEGRHLKKRPTEFRVDRVLQPFDSAKFNFTKVGQEEALFQFENSGSDDSYFLRSAAATVADRAPNVVAINVSPIEYGHVLLIPRVLDHLPQRIDQESFLLALHMAAEAASPYFRLGYNSLGAFATINHLHFQAYYLTVPFPVEKAATQRIPLAEGGIKSGVKVSKLMNYPVRGLVFEEGNTLNDLANLVSSACIWLQDNNVPYNVLISDSGRKIFLFPQCYAEKQALGEVSQELLDTQVNPAVWEISGHIVLKRRDDYEEASEASAWRLLAEVSLSEARFEEVKAYIFDAACLVQSQVEEETDDAIYAPVPVGPSAVGEGCLVIP